MTETTTFLQQTEIPDDSLEILKQELELAIQWQTPSILIVAYESEFVYRDSLSAAKNSLIDLGQKVLWIHAQDQNDDTIDYWLNGLGDEKNVVFFIDGLNENLTKKKSFRSVLDHWQHIFFERCIRVVFWLTYKEASQIAYSAPDFWVRRQRLLELVASPKPEQILQYALESAWQGTGEYSNRFEDTDAMIALQKSILTELPQNAESTAMRANLLLTLGVLNWRKGNYEKSKELLQNALKIAAKMDDNWFEAECFNALALVKSSLGEHNDAIDSYKQAIKLAPNQIFAWNNLGNLSLKIGRNDEAMIAFQKAIERNQEDPISWNGVGDVYSSSEYPDDAITAYRKSIEYSPLLPYPWNGLGEVYMSIGRFDDAVIAFQKAIKLSPHFITPWLRLATLYTKQERYRDAVKVYERALLLEPNNSLIWNDLGLVHLNAEKNEDAIDAFSKAVELDHGFGWAYSNLGLAYTNSGKPEESIAQYKKSLDMPMNESHKSITWNRLANSYRLLNDYDNAVKAYRMADFLNVGTSSLGMKNATKEPGPASVSDTNLEAETNKLTKQDSEHRDKVEWAESRSGEETSADIPFWVFQPLELSEEKKSSALDNVVPVHSHGGTATMLINDNDSNSRALGHESGGTKMQMTLPFFSKFILREKNDPLTQNDSFERNAPQTNLADAHLWNEKGNAHFRSGAYQEAILDYSKAIMLDSSFGRSYCNLGMAYLKTGKYAEAILLLQKSLELLTTDEDRAVAWNELGNLYRCLNDYDNAIVSYQKADELDPNNIGTRDDVEYFHSEPNASNARVWNELGEIFFKSGSYHEAAKSFEKAIQMEPLNGTAYSNLGLCFTYLGKFQDAIPLYHRSIELSRDDELKAASWNRLGNVYRRLNDYVHAMDAYQKAVKLNKNQTKLVTRTRFSLLGNCYVD